MDERRRLAVAIFEDQRAIEPFPHRRPLIGNTMSR
jgi:hypothetical protein